LLGCTQQPHGVQLVLEQLPNLLLVKVRQDTRSIPKHGFPEIYDRWPGRLWPVCVDRCGKNAHGSQSRCVSEQCDLAAAHIQLVIEASVKVAGTFHSTQSTSLQRSAALPFTAWPTFRDYGWCGLYGGIRARCKSLLRWQLSGNFPGQLPLRAPRPSSSTRANSSRRAKVRSHRQGSNSVPLWPQPPHDHVLIGALFYPLRSLARRRRR
jgi:hypothetical protein